MNRKIIHGWMMGLMVVSAFTMAQAGEWRLHTAMAWRGGMDVNITSGKSYTGDNPWNRSSGTRSSDYVWDSDTTTYTPVSLSTSGKYADGYMEKSPFTDDTTHGWYGMTWNWGFDNNSQHDAASQTLTLTRQVTGTMTGSARTGKKSTTATVVNNTVGYGDADEDFTALGAEIGVEKDVYRNDQWSVGLLFCVDGFDPQTIEKSETVWQGTMTEKYYETTRVESDFAASGVYSQTSVFGDPFNVIPAAPHNGSAPGPVINYNASSSTYTPIGTPQPITAGTVTESTRLVSSRTWQGISVVDYDLDIDHYAFRIGPTINWRHHYVTVGLQPWLSLNYVDLSAKRTEKLTITNPDGTHSDQAWNESSSNDEWIFGSGIKASVNVAITEDIFCGVDAGYDWFSQKPETSIGPSKMSVDFSGYEVGLVLGLQL